MQTDIKQNWFYNCPAKTVWEYLTNAELLSLWLMNSDIKPMLGHKFLFTMRAFPEWDFDGKVYCEILEIIPYKKLVYSWKAGPEPGKLTMDTLVTWTLVPKEKGTELLLAHTGFGPLVNKDIFQAMVEGWKK